MTPVPPIGAHQLLVLLVQLGVMLGVALVLGRAAVRLGMPAIVGELAAGLILGPSLLQHLTPGPAAWLFPRDAAAQHLLDAVGQLGVLLLVALAGMHIDLPLVRRQASTVIAVSTGGLVVPLLLGVGVAYLLPAPMLGTGDRTLFALFLGVALCVTALPVIAKMLLEMRLLHRDVGQVIVAAAAIVDIAGWFLLSIVSGMVGSGTSGGQVVRSVAYLAMSVGFTAVVARPVVHHCLRSATRTGEPGVAVAAVVVLVLLSSAGTQALGLEPILGAFLCGILIGSAPLTAPLTPPPDLTSLRTFVIAVLAPLFFVCAGQRMDLTALCEPTVLVAGVGVLLVAIGGKFVGAYAGARLGRLGHWPGLAIAAGLNARGVVEIVIAMAGLRLGVLTTASFTVIVLVAVVTTIMAAPLLRLAARHLPVTAAEQARERLLLGPAGEARP